VYDEDALVGLHANVSLCAGVTICATIVARKFDFYMLTPETLENRVNLSTSDAPVVQI